MKYYSDINDALKVLRELREAQIDCKNAYRTDAPNKNYMNRIKCEAEASADWFLSHFNNGQAGTEPAL